MFHEKNPIRKFYTFDVLSEFRISQIKTKNFPEIILGIKEQFTEFEVQRRKFTQTLQTK